jgi:bifunctional UDP-N-acetylglucosamine pyrophosphorylase/glucosamine-1-phosphate N-acetyltransferase
VLGFRAAVPTGYGRLVMEGDQLAAIREESDASPLERMITLCNAGVMAMQGRHALNLLRRIGNGNAKGEYYLTDAVEIARTLELTASVVETTEDEVRGINTKSQLAEAEAALQRKLRDEAMAAGVTLVAPETIYLAADTRFGKDVTVEPFVVFGPGVTVGDGAVIRSFSHIAEASVGAGAIVGPYTRLRPGAMLGENVHIGNFVEVKATTIEAGAKANHLAYLGDAHIGANVNIGAGTITCNYDGFDKYRTEIGAGAFIGSNSALVAPIKIGEGAYVGSGSVVTKDVPANALALERSEQTVKPGWAERFREMKLKAKAALARSQ